MGTKTMIFGKSTCPFTNAAREAFTKDKIDFEYIDVVKEPSELGRMLKFSNGSRTVPVIVQDEKVTLGYKGKG